MGTPNEAGDLAWHDGERVVAVQRGPARLPDALLRVRPVASVLRRVVAFSFMLRVRGFLRQARPDIVQVNRTLGVWILPLLMPSQMRFIFDVRQINEGASADLIGKLRERRVIRVWQMWCRSIYHHACFCHVADAHRILGKGWSRWGSVVPAGVDQRFLTLRRTDSASGSHENLVRFIYTGTLSRLRYLEQILFAVQRMLHKTDEFRVVLLGPDAAQGFYHGLVNELKLNSVVTIEPPVRYEDIPEVVFGYDVALAYLRAIPGWRYRPALKVLEYRALGIPIIATDIEANREIVEDGVNGLLVQDSVESLAEGMLRFITDRDFLGHCQANARMMRQGLTWTEVAKMYEDVYLGCQARDDLG
jgi:glycosyltransferase involved in cell wall biosynthesis